MPKSARTKAARTRASFGRAERLQREAGETRPARPARSRKQPFVAHAAATPKQEMKRAAPARPTAAFNAVTGPERERPRRPPTTPEIATRRAERVREIADRQQHQRIKEQTRGSFNRESERRRDADRRTEHDRKRAHVQAIIKRTEDGRKRTTQRQAERKRAEMRRSFANAGENPKLIEAAARQKEFERRAATAIDRDHKQRSTDQQSEHRRQTSETRDRHRGEIVSFRSNEDAAMERHHHGIKGIDDREARALADFDGRRKGLVGSIAERIPGRRDENDRKRDAMVKGFETERLTKHRDFEATKERQFEIAQRARLQQAIERKALFEMHRDDRARFQLDHARNRPTLIDGRVRALDRAEPALEISLNRGLPEANRAIDRPTVSMHTPSSGNATQERAEPVRQDNERPEPARDDGREVERPFHAFGRI